MFYRVETKTITLRLFHDPTRPVFDLFRDRMIAKIDILAHQVIEITQFIINLIVPALSGVVINDFKNAIFIGVFDMVNATKAFEIPNELRIFSCTGREGITRPAFAFDNFIINLRAIIFVDSLNTNRFFFVRAHLVIHYHIQQDGNIVTFQGIDRAKQLRFITIFGRNGAFLIKLT